MNNIKIHRPQIQQIKKPTTHLVDDTKYIPDEIKEAAKGLEAQFNELMVKEMTKSLSQEDNSVAGNFYKDLQTTEKAKALVSDSSQIQKLILDEIYPKHLRNSQNYDGYVQQKNKYSKSKIVMNEGPNLQKPDVTMQPKEEIGVKYE